MPDYGLETKILLRASCDFIIRWSVGKAHCDEGVGASLWSRLLASGGTSSLLQEENFRKVLICLFLLSDRELLTLDAATNIYSS